MSIFICFVHPMSLNKCLMHRKSQTKNEQSNHFDKDNFPFELNWKYFFFFFFLNSHKWPSTFILMLYHFGDALAQSKWNTFRTTILHVENLCLLFMNFPNVNTSMECLSKEFFFFFSFDWISPDGSLKVLQF